MLLIQTDRETLLTGLQSVTGIVERRHTLPILSNVLFEGHPDHFSFTATDLEIQVKSDQSVKLDQSFAITVSAKKLQDILRALPESTKVSLDQQDSKVVLKAGKSRFSLQTLPAEDFPKFALADGGEVKYEITQKELKHLLNQAQFAMAQQDIRYYLNGMLLVLGSEDIKVVSTDGHRLSFAAGKLVSGGGSNEVIVPRKTVLELLRLLNDSEDKVSLEVGKNQIRFNFNSISLHSKVVDGKFPDYTKVIPKDHKNIFKINRLLMLQALQRAAILSNEKFRGVRLVLTQDSVKLISTNSEQEEAQEEMEIDYKGDPLDIGFNVSYLLDVLNNNSSDDVQCAFGDSNSSGLITIPGEENFKYVVMPMRI